MKNLLAVIGLLAIGYILVTAYSEKISPSEANSFQTPRQQSNASPVLSPQSDCGTSDIAVEKLSGREERRYIFITGKVVNNCDKATGVQIKITLYDNAGSVLASDDIYPASTNNIPSKSDFPFEWHFKRVEGFSKFNVRVISLKKW